MLRSDRPDPAEPVSPTVALVTIQARGEPKMLSVVPEHRLEAEIALWSLVFLRGRAWIRFTVKRVTPDDDHVIYKDTGAPPPSA